MPLHFDEHLHYILQWCTCNSAEKGYHVMSNVALNSIMKTPNIALVQSM